MIHQTVGRMRSAIPALLMVFIVLLVEGCGGTAELSSSWSANTVAIDGQDTEWGAGLTNLKDTKLFLGVQNDQDFLYIRLKSADEQFRRQMVGLGLTIWFESGNGNRLGILYPIGMMKQNGMPPANQEDGNEPADRERFSERGLQDMEILGPGKNDRNLFSVIQAPGMNMKVGGSKGGTVYDLKIPLKKSSDHPYALDASGGSIVKIDIETGKFDPESRPSGRGGGRRGGGGRPPRGGGPPGEGMPEGGMSGGERTGGRMPRGNRPDPVNVSVKVRLASGGSSSLEH